MATRRALRVLRDAGMMPRYSAKDRVVFDCGHCAVIDAPVRIGGVYSAFCPVHEDWRVIVRRAGPKDSLAHPITEESDQPLW